MKLIAIQKLLYKLFTAIILLLLLCSSCTNKTQQELASTDTVKEIEENVGANYIINKRTGKVHSYTHGAQIIENKDNILETNDSLENILKNEYMDDKLGYGIDLWGTNSETFATENAFTLKLTKTKRFALYELEKISNHNNNTSSTSTNIIVNLEPGDLICRKNHVEFYIGNNKVVGWGKIHNTYTSYKSLNKKADGYYYNADDIHKKNKPYTSLIKFRR